MGADLKGLISRLNPYCTHALVIDILGRRRKNNPIVVEPLHRHRVWRT